MHSVRTSDVSKGRFRWHGETLPPDQALTPRARGVKQNGFESPCRRCAGSGRGERRGHGVASRRGFSRLGCEARRPARVLSSQHRVLASILSLRRVARPRFPGTLARKSWFDPRGFARAAFQCNCSIPSPSSWGARTPKGDPLPWSSAEWEALSCARLLFRIRVPAGKARTLQNAMTCAACHWLLAECSPILLH